MGKGKTKTVFYFKISSSLSLPSILIDMSTLLDGPPMESGFIQQASILLIFGMEKLVLF